MKANYAACLKEVLKHEGGYVNHPKDPGGATNKGITQRVYDGFRVVSGKSKRSVKEITDGEVEAIYRRQYWDAIRGDDLPAGVDFSTFDYAVNSGVGRASRALQEALLVKVDGQIGMVTIGRVCEVDAARVIGIINTGRLAFLKRLKTWPTFGRGWGRRVKETREISLKMAAAGA